MKGPADACHFHDSLRSPGTTKMHPMVAAALHNATSSTLCRLPEEVLLCIMRHTDTMSAECLKRSCRLFLRLFYELELCRARGDNVWATDPRITPKLALKWGRNEDNGVRNPWRPPYASVPVPMPSLNVWTPMFRAVLRVQLARDDLNLCPSCRSAQVLKLQKKSRLARKKAKLYCSGCHTYHPASFFSRPDRKKLCSRQCIAQQGFIRLCSHETISWDSLRRDARNQYDENRKILSLAYENDKAIPTGISQTVRRCSHASHSPSHHIHTKGGSTGCEESAPQARVEYIRGYDQCLVLECHSHLLMPETDHGIFSSELELLLRESRKGAAEFIAPELGPGRLPEMNCFDPNRCSCVRYEGATDLKNWEPNPWAIWTANTCRRRPEYRLSALAGKSATHSSSTARTSTSTHSSSKARISTSTLNARNVHLAEIHTNVGLRSGASKLSITARPCSSGNPQCLCFEYKRLIPLREFSISAAWFQALDPDSMGSEGDVTDEGSPWCRSSACQNYYRYMRRTLNCSTGNKTIHGHELFRSGTAAAVRSVYYAIRGAFMRS